MDTASRLLELPDRRLLGYAEFGALDGLPLFYNHGFPASRLEARLVESEAAKLGLRLIAVDRPGFGLSTPQPGRGLLDWPRDIVRLADHLGLERFAMLGVSGGGPATLACAWELADRLSAVSIVCGLGPVAETDLRQAMHWPARFSFGLARQAPGITGILFGRLIGPLLGRTPELTLRLLTIAAPAADRRFLQRPKIRRRLTDSLREAFRQGGQGPASELILLTTPWPFQLERIKIPIELWHGRKDATVPFCHAEHLAARLAAVTCRYFTDEGHFSLPLGQAGAIFESLRSRHLAGVAAVNPSGKSVPPAAARTATLNDG